MPARKILSRKTVTAFTVSIRLECWLSGSRKRTTMTPRSFAPALRQVRQLLARSDAAGSSDAQLLHRFVNGAGEAAFALLVWRHGPMALGVCRRMLPNVQDADDAFQTTLLALA